MADELITPPVEEKDISGTPQKKAISAGKIAASTALTNTLAGIIGTMAEAALAGKEKAEFVIPLSKGIVGGLLTMIPNDWAKSVGIGSISSGIEDVINKYVMEPYVNPQIQKLITSIKGGINQEEPQV